jgi:hypothetical protein
MLDAWFYAMVYICQSKGLDHLYKPLRGSRAALRSKSSVTYLELEITEHINCHKDRCFVTALNRLNAHTNNM